MAASMARSCLLKSHKLTPALWPIRPNSAILTVGNRRIFLSGARHYVRSFRRHPVKVIPADTNLDNQRTDHTRDIGRKHKQNKPSSTSSSDPDHHSEASPPSRSKMNSANVKTEKSNNNKLTSSSDLQRQRDRGAEFGGNNKLNTDEQAADQSDGDYFAEEASSNIKYEKAYANDKRLG